LRRSRLPRRINGAYVASVEGDSPRGGYRPDLRDLIIRRVADGTETHVTLPCGRVPQCWPASPAWSPDGKHTQLLAIENARKEVGTTEAGAAIAGDLDAAPTEQRIAELTDGSLRWASPADLFV